MERRRLRGIDPVENAAYAEAKMREVFNKYNMEIIEPDDIENSIIERVNAATELRDILHNAREVQRLEAMQPRNPSEGEDT